MKKILALLLAAALITLSTGCGVNDNSPINSIKKAEPSRGTINGDVYESEYLGLKFTKPESWIYSTDEDIAAMSGISAELLGEDFKALLDANPAIFDMMARDILSGTNINISYENLTKSASTNITEEQYVAALKQQFANIPEITVDFPDKLQTLTLGENDYTKVITTTTMSGIEMTQVYYLNKIDNYMSCIIVTITGDEEIADIEAMFE